MSAAGIAARDKLDNKEVVVGIRKRDGDLRFFHASDARAGTLAKYIREHVSEDVEIIFTDDASANEVAVRNVGRGTHKVIKHSGGVYVMGDIHTNTVESAFSLIKRGITGTWHRISAKHLPAYLEEMDSVSIAERIRIYLSTPSGTWSLLAF
jgi:transposase-like protein